MNDLIDKVALMDALAKRVPYVIDTSDEVAFAQGLDAAYQCVVDAPTVDAEPVVHARWMQDDTLKDLYFCSKCLTRDHRKPRHKFCPDCGARMDADAPERAGKEREGG